MTDDERNPVISVIVPVYNEAPRIRANFAALMAQRNAPDYEVIYVDDCSTDGSWDILRVLARGEQAVRIERLQSRETVGAVRAAAVRLSRGRIIANVDSDCEPSAEWLAQYRHLSSTVGILGFPVVPPSDLEYLHHKFRYKGTGQYPRGNLPHGCGALIRKELILEAGNFPDTMLGEDTRLFHEILTRGANVLLLDYPPIHLLEKRIGLRQHLRRYYQMGWSSDSRSRKLYALAILFLLFGFAAASVEWSFDPLLSGIFLVVSLGALANPVRIAHYMRSFELPRNRLLKFACFASIKILETTCLLAGFAGSVLETKSTPSTKKVN
jgi:glycosyltransferase involved in cell wall biosynthesis